MAKVALYARVSTEDKDQNPENQILPMRAWCLKEGHQIIEPPYIDFESGKNAVDREAVQRLFAELNMLDGIVIVRPDRMFRNRTDAGNYVNMILKANKFLYIIERSLMVNRDTPKTTLATLGFEWQASELFSAILADSVKAAYNRKKAGTPDNQKVRWGRKPMMAVRIVIDRRPDGSLVKRKIYDIPIDSEKVLKLYREGCSLREIASALGCSVTPVRNVVLGLRSHQRSSGEPSVHFQES